MTSIVNVSAAIRRVSPGLRMAGLAIAAGLACGAATATPASAAAPDWRAGCQYTSAPQGYGDSMRYTNCMRQRDCQVMANAAGTTMFTAGCFGVTPDAPAAAPGRRPGR